MNPPSVVGLGLATLDYLGVVPTFPEKNSKSVLDVLSIQGGGPAATATAAAAKLGVPARFVGKVADDDFGRTILKGLEEVGADVRCVVRTPGGTSPVSFVAIDKTDGSRTVFHSPGNLSPLAVEELDWSFLENTGVLLIDGRQHTAQLEAARRAKARGIRILLDADSPRPGMDALLRLSDVVIASESFAEKLGTRLEDRLARLAADGANVVIVTLGDQGAWGMQDGHVFHQPAHRVTVVDTTGCGDVFHGAYAAGMLRDLSPQRCTAFASAAAALKCRALGGRSGLPTLAEVHELLGWPS
jgi:sulfofructose kinase